MNIEIMYEGTSHCFTPRTFDIMEHFRKIMEKRGENFQNISDLIFFMGHLALTHIYIQDLKQEYSELEKELNQNSMISKIFKK